MAKFNDDEGKHLWSKLLEEVRENSSDVRKGEKCLFVIGESECGKSSLISRLQGIEDIDKSFGVEYGYIQVKDEERDEEAKLGCFVLDGNLEMMRLYRYGINEKNFSDCLAVMVVSMEEPWRIMPTLNELYDRLQRHVEMLRIDDEDRREMKASLELYAREYQDNAAAMLSSNETLKSSRRHNNPLHPTNINLTSHSHLPLSDKCLSRNCGLPFIIIVTKTDVMDQVKQQYGYDDEHFEVLQIQIRQFALERGAALFYTSIKENKNCEVLRRYLFHRVYGMSFNQPAYVVEKDCVFVPCGWDSPHKIQIVADSLVKLKSSLGDLSNPNTLVSSHQTHLDPPIRPKTVGTATAAANMSGTIPAKSGGSVSMPEVVCEDEQKFLEKINEEINKSRKSGIISGSGSGASTSGINNSAAAAADRSSPIMSSRNNPSSAVLALKARNITTQYLGCKGIMASTIVTTKEHLKNNYIRKCCRDKRSISCNYDDSHLLKRRNDFVCVRVLPCGSHQNTSMNSVGSPSAASSINHHHYHHSPSGVGPNLGSSSSGGVSVSAGGGHGSSSSSATAVGGGLGAASAGAAGDGVLANFFNSLLKKTNVSGTTSTNNTVTTASSSVATPHSAVSPNEMSPSKHYDNQSPPKSTRTANETNVSPSQSSVDVS